MAKDLTNCCEVSRLLVTSLPKSYSLSAVSKITFEKLYADEWGNFCIEAISDETVFRANVHRVNTGLVTSRFIVLVEFHVKMRWRGDLTDDTSGFIDSAGELFVSDDITKTWKKAKSAKGSGRSRERREEKIDEAWNYIPRNTAVLMRYTN